jgi:hypothetical protein
MAAKHSIFQVRQRAAASGTVFPASSIADRITSSSTSSSPAPRFCKSSAKTRNRDPRPSRIPQGDPTPAGPHRRRFRVRIRGGTVLLLRAHVNPEPDPLLLKMPLIPRISSSAYVQSRRRLRGSAGKHDSETRWATPRGPEPPSTTTSLYNPVRASSIDQKCRNNFNAARGGVRPSLRKGGYYSYISALKWEERERGMHRRPCQ